MKSEAQRIYQKHPEVMSLPGETSRIEAELRPNIPLPGGRTGEFLGNPQGSGIAFANRQQMYLYLARKGVIEFPEMEAKDKHGQLVPGAVAIYVDSRIGAQRVGRLTYKWLADNEPTVHGTIYGLGKKAELAPQDLSAALERGMDELGITDALKAIEAADAARREDVAGHMPLDQIMRDYGPKLK